MDRTYTSVGKEYTKDRDKIDAILDRLQWQAPPLKLSRMDADAIEEAIAQCRIPKVSHVAVSNELAPFGLEGIRAQYKNGLAQIYLLHIGTEVVIIATDFEAN